LLKETTGPLVGLEPKTSTLRVRRATLKEVKLKTDQWVRFAIKTSQH